MPIVEFSSKDILRGKIVTPGWYLLKIDSVGESESSKGDSTNYPVEGVIIRNVQDGSEEFTGVPIIWNFNSKAKGFMIPFLKSFGVDVQPGQRFSLDSAVGQELQVFVENGTFDGRLKNQVNHKYRPANADVTAPPE